MQNSSAFQYLAIDTVHESTTNPRRTFDETKLQELADEKLLLKLADVPTPAGPTQRQISPGLVQITTVRPPFDVAARQASFLGMDH
jgi:hypothetical protein